MELIQTQQTQDNLFQSFNNKDLINSFINELDVSIKTKTSYKIAINQFVKYIDNKDILDITRLDILKYKEDLKAQNKSNSTISLYVFTIKRFYSWLESKEIIKDISKGIKGSKTQKGFKKDSFTLKQTKDILDCINTNTLEGKRDYAIVNLLLRTGLRTIEITRACISDIKQEGGEAILYIQGKGRESKDDFIFLTDKVLKPIYIYLEARKYKCENEPLFKSVSNRNKNNTITTNSVSRLVKNIIKKAGILNKKLTTHSFRHTAITFCLLAGASIQEAQVLARHKDINTTLIYSHNINRVLNAPEKKIDSYLNF